MRATARLLISFAVVVALLAGATRNAPAAPPVLTVDIAAFPAGAAVPLSTPSQPTYIGYTIAVANPSQNVWRNVTLTDPAPNTSLGGATIVFVANCPNGPNGSVELATVTCSFGTLVAGATPPAVTIIVRTPTSGESIVNVAQVAGDEGGTDASSSNTNSARHDLFFSPPVTNPLTSDTTDSATSYAPPGSTLKLTTDPNVSRTNRQVTAGAFPSVAGRPLGYLVRLAETPVTPAETCNGVPATSPAFSTIDVAADPLDFAANFFEFTFTITVSPGSYQRASDVHLCHRTALGSFDVPRAGAGTDPTGDAITNVQFLNANRTLLRVVVSGPGNGEWFSW